MPEGALQLVPFTRNLPFRRVCLLKVRRQVGPPALGTGWFFGESLVITAAHVVTEAPEASRDTAVSVWPARHDSNDKPFGIWSSVKVECSRIDGKDYAGIFLDEPVGARVGTFGIGSVEAIPSNARVAVVGYNENDGGQGQYCGEGNVSAVTPTGFRYDILTTAGQSGAPVWSLDNSDLVVGIHVREREALTITDDVLVELLKWRNGA